MHTVDEVAATQSRKWESYQMDRNNPDETYEFPRYDKNENIIIEYWKGDRPSGLIIDMPDGSTRGADPKSVSLEDLRAAGHAKKPLLKVIREYCIECSGGSKGEARKCTAARGCSLWPYRTGKNPFTARPGNPASLRRKNPALTAEV